MQHTESFYTIFRGEGVSFGWKHAKKDFFFFLQLFVIVGVINAIPNLINRAMGWPQDANNIGTVIAAIGSLICSFGLIKIYLHTAAERKSKLEDLFNHDWKRFIRWLIAKVVSGVLVVLGLILLVIPGIYVAARLYLYEFFAVDQDMNAIEAISASREVTKDHVREIIGIWFLSLGILILGAIPVGIGLLWAVPTISIAKAKLYKKLMAHHHTHHTA